MNIDYIQSRLEKGKVQLGDSNSIPCVIYYEDAHQPNMHQRTRQHETFIPISEFPTEDQVLAELATYWYVEIEHVQAQIQS